MRLTNRGRGAVMGLIIAATGTLGYTFHDAEPVLKDPGIHHEMPAMDNDPAPSMAPTGMGLPVGAQPQDPYGSHRCMMDCNQKIKHHEWVCSEEGWHFDPETFTCKKD